MVPPLVRRLIIIVIISLGALLGFMFCASYAGQARFVRVNILEGATSLRLKIDGFYKIEDALTHEILYRGKNLNTTVTVFKDNILIGAVNPRANKIFIKANDPEAININGRRFRGDMQLVKDSGVKLSVINYIELQDYVKGISVREISHYWPVDALKAEVIVFRTFALYKIEESAGKDYDLTSDIYSQVYSGKAAERYRINKAVDETKGLVLTYKGKVFPAFYHATCAGHTADASLLWNIDIPPLKGVICDFCKESPHFKWHYVSTSDEIRNQLIKAGYKLGVIKEIVILGRDNSGRITDLKITSAKQEVKISAKDFRNILGPNIIRSTNFKVSIASADVIFEGFGWGHGVGLCQWGAYFMAKQGYKYDQILDYYYPQTEISLLN